jgi:hypothetical protein
MPSKEYPVKFIRTNVRKRKWYVHQIVTGGLSTADEDDRYRWHFYYEQEAPRVIRRLAKFGLKAEVDIDLARAVISGKRLCHISVTFKNDIDEAEFILNALADRITLTDYHYKP